MHVCVYVHIYVYVVIFVWKCMIWVNSTPVLQLYFRATCDKTKRFRKIGVIENGQRNDAKCVRIV